MPIIRLLSVTIHDLDLRSAHDAITRALAGNTPLCIVTPNPEILLHAHRHPEYAGILNRADIALPDGRGLRLTSAVRHTLSGTNIAEDILNIAESKKLRVCCIVRADGRSTLDEVRASVQQRAPNAEITVIGMLKNQWNDEKLCSEIQRIAPHVIFIGLGFPEQEYWLDRYARRIPSVRIAIAIGGAFDFWTGVAKRAPKRIQRIGLEWLWRFIHEPRRWKRIWNAVVIFPLTVVWARLTATRSSQKQ